MKKAQAARRRRASRGNSGLAFGGSGNSLLKSLAAKTNRLREAQRSESHESCHGRKRPTSVPSQLTSKAGEGEASQVAKVVGRDRAYRPKSAVPSFSRPSENPLKKGRPLSLEVSPGPGTSIEDSTCSHPTSPRTAEKGEADVVDRPRDYTETYVEGILYRRDNVHGISDSLRHQILA